MGGGTGQRAEEADGQGGHREGEEGSRPRWRDGRVEARRGDGAVGVPQEGGRGRDSDGVQTSEQLREPRGQRGCCFSNLAGRVRCDHARARPKDESGERGRR